MTKYWTVQDAKAQLSEILRRARAGDPQRIGMTDACIVVSETEWSARTGQEGHLGKWLVESAPRGEEINLPSREVDRGDPFANRAGEQRQLRKK